MASPIDDLQKAYSICIGTFLEILGLIGFVSRPIAGILGVNVTMSFIHLVVGALGWFALKGLGKTYNGAMGTVLLLLGALGIFQGSDGVLSSALGINAATSVLHAVVGGVSMALAFGVKD